MDEYGELHLGVSKVDITPPWPISLAGFAHRKDLSEGIIRPLYAHFYLFQQNEFRFLLVSADLIWWGDHLVISISQSIEEKWGISSECVCLHATHNHSGPQTSNQFTPSLGIVDSSYLEWLPSQIHEGVRTSLENLEPVTIEVGKGKWSGGINRRKIINQICTMAPNEKGLNDQTVTAIRFMTKTKATKGLLIHATCHPTTTDENLLSSEFPGLLVEELEKEFKDQSIVVGFLQGFCGDIRPKLVRDNQFFRGTDEFVKEMVSGLKEAVLKILNTNMKKESKGQLSLQTHTLDLPFASVPSIKELTSQKEEDGIKGEWARELLKKSPSIPRATRLELTFIQLAKSVSLLTANAEMVVKYGEEAKKILGGSLLPLGYTNGMIGYVPTARQLEQGGYESIESTPYFALPSPFSKEIEYKIIDKFYQIKRGLGEP